MVDNSYSELFCPSHSPRPSVFPSFFFLHSTSSNLSYLLALFLLPHPPDLYNLASIDPHLALTKNKNEQESEKKKKRSERISVDTMGHVKSIFLQSMKKVLFFFSVINTEFCSTCYVAPIYFICRRRFFHQLRIMFAIDLLFSPRSIGKPCQIKKVANYDDKNPTFVPSW